MGAAKTGRFWDWWLRAYYASRIVVTVHVERVSSWPDLACHGARTVVGRPVPDGPPASQRPPRGGTAPRVELAPAARRLKGLPHVLAAYVGADGFPEVVPVTLGRTDPSGITLHGPLPLGARRAGLLAHRYEPQLIGLRTVTHTGWLDEGIYAPHTAAGFRAPANKTLLLLANGFAARRGQRQASVEDSGSRRIPPDRPYASRPCPQRSLLRGDAGPTHASKMTSERRLPNSVNSPPVRSSSRSASEACGTRCVAQVASSTGSSA